MAAETLTVTLTDGTSDLVFSKMSESGYTSRWGYNGNSATVRLFIDITHDISNLGSAKSDIHQLVFRREEINSTTGKLVVSSVSIQVKVPKDSTITTADINNDISMLACLFNVNFMNYFVIGINNSGDYNVTGPFNPART